MDEKVMSIKDLIDYLQTLPQDAELFPYSGNGGFYSLDSTDEIQLYFKFDKEENSLYIDHVRYEMENRERLAQGKEWVDLIK